VQRSIAELPGHTSGASAYGWWGMVWLIATEAMLFSALLASYFYIRYQSGVEWPPDGIEPPRLALPLLMSAILWSSSIPVHLAERGIRKGDQTALRFGLLAGFLLGATFLILQVAIEYPEVAAEFVPEDGAYASLFFTITGFHGIHVLVGLLISAWTQVRAWRGAFSSDRHLTVQNFTMYWHFVDVVWVFILSSLYLSPHL
jgi:heme/copper-type cytochrome/quinol oxidase subunit 3